MHGSRRAERLVALQVTPVQENVVEEPVVAAVDITQSNDLRRMRLVYRGGSGLCYGHNRSGYQVVRKCGALRPVPQGFIGQKNVIVHHKRTVVDLEKEVGRVVVQQVA